LSELLQNVAWRVVALVSKGHKPSLFALKMGAVYYSETFITIC